MSKVLMHRRGTNILYPDPTKDGLKVWYDLAGKRNTDDDRDIVKDLSGNNNDAELYNFNFTEESGYKDNTLVFDGVDDSLTIPELALDETAMTVMHDGKLYAYEDDKVITVNKHSDGVRAELEGLEVGGRNYLRNSDFSKGMDEYWARMNSSPRENFRVEDGLLTVTSNPGSKSDFGRTNFIQENQLEGQEYITISSLIKGTGSLTVRFGGINMSTKSIDNDDFKRVVFVIPRANFGNGNLIIGISSGELTFDRIKAETGSKATEWTPSPEDFQTTSLSPSSLSNLQLYNRPLRKNELLHNAESKGLKQLKPGIVVQDGLILHYDFSHESNTSEYKDKAFDYSGNGNHGVLNNFNFTEESGYLEDGLKFDGIDDEVIVGTFSDSRFHQPAMTVEWTGIIREEQPLSGINHIFTGGYVAGWALGFHGQYNGLMATVKDSNGASGYRISYPLPNPIRDIPYNLVMVFQQGSKKEYLNGVLVSEDNNFGFPDYTSTPQVRIAKSAYQSTLSCKIYNRPLTPEEIAHNYAIEKEKYNITEGEI